jgi:hypothetical protein
LKSLELLRKGYYVGFLSSATFCRILDADAQHQGGLDCCMHLYLQPRR